VHPVEVESYAKRTGHRVNGAPVIPAAVSQIKPVKEVRTNSMKDNSLYKGGDP